MTKIITVASHKGGVGKTTVAYNLGFALSRLGHKVLLIEGDPAGALTIAGGLNQPGQQGLIQLLRKKTTLRQIAVMVESANMYIVGGGVRDPAEALYLDRCAQNGHLAQLLKYLGNYFDYLLIDAPSGINNLSMTFLANSTGVIIPITCKALSIKTLSLFLGFVQQTRNSFNSSLRIEGLLINMIDNRSLKEVQAYEALRLSLPTSVLYKNFIPYDDCFETATTEGLPVALVDNGEHAFQSIVNVAKELISRNANDTQRGALK